MLIRLFMWVFVKHLLYFVGGMQAAFHSLNILSHGAASAAAPYILALSITLAIIATISDTMEKYIGELSSLQGHLGSVKRKLEDESSNLKLT